jgi:2-polyprenyl-3-methyl-5-hydroxy-6-metoxy-1,4-benzoquinol methylase
MKNNCFKYNSTNSSLKNIINFGKFPYINSPISLSQKKKILSKFKAKDLYGILRIRYYQRYNHLKVDTHINNKLLNFFYSKFYNYPSFIKKKELPIREKTFLRLFKSFFKKKDLFNKNKDVLEIGCFDGILLKELKKIKFNVEGCEPSDGAKIAKKNGINVIKDFFKPCNYKKKFNIVIARHAWQLQY